MVTVLVSWIILLVASLLFGYVFINVVYKNGNEHLRTLDIYIVAGMLVINVYAEIFSLFYKVGVMACFLLTLLGVVTIGGYCFKTKDYFKRIVISKERISLYSFIIIIFSVSISIAWTVLSPQHYDTALYHQQAIAWIEEYGVVPGLGNFHNRFAYNSAFMCLQALFSFKWLIGQSLHTVNGFVVCMAMMYCLLTLKMFKKSSEGIFISDLLKMATLIYIFLNRNEISSPSSDTLALLLVMYICMKWSCWIEEDNKEPYAYTFLCVVGVWAITVKLSVATIVLLAIYPIYLWVKEKQYKQIVANLALGVFIAVPWLIRNVIISGYLLYPYPQIDLFNVDWKMPESVLTWDSREIIVWGRRVNDVALYEQGLFEWLPQWFSANDHKLLIVTGFIAVIFLMIYTIWSIVKHKNYDLRQHILEIYCLTSLVVWIFSAPLLRYGMIYLMLPICLVVGIITERIKRVNLNLIARGAVLLIFIPCLCIMYQQVLNTEERFMIRQGDYAWNEMEEYSISEGIKIWTPVSGDQGSADVFPNAPYLNMIKKIEFRGESFEQGFKLQDEYKDLKLNTYGVEW